MASKKFPDSGSRMVVYRSGAAASFQTGELFADEDCTTPAEVYADTAGTKGAAISGSSVDLDQFGRQPDYWGPVAGTDHLYIRVNGVVSRVDADYDARLDSVERLVINVKDYGAIGDGSTDDTAALAAAVAALPDSGGTLYFPAAASHYAITAGMTISGKTRVTIAADAAGTEIRYAAGTADTVYGTWPNLGKDSIFRIMDCTDVLIENLTLNGNLTNRIGSSGTESFNSNLLLVASTRVTVRNCVLTEAMTDGLTVLYNQSGTLCADLRIAGCTISKGRRNNVSLVGQDGCAIDGCTIVDAGTVQGASPESGIQIEPDGTIGRSKNVRITNSTISGSAGSYAISFAGTGTTGIVFAGNNVHDNAGNGLNLSVGPSGTNSQAVVTGNIFTGHTGVNAAGVRVTSTACDLIADNTITGNTYGIVGASSVDGLTIRGNKFQGNRFNAVQMTSFVKVITAGNVFIDNTSSTGDSNGAGFAWRGDPATVNSIATFDGNLLFNTAGNSPLMSGARVDSACNATATGNLAKNLKSNASVAFNFRLASNWSVDLTGSPEGVVTAPVGSLYQRADGGAGSTLYLKETGSAATGWTAAGAAGTSGQVSYLDSGTKYVVPAGVRSTLPMAASVEYATPMWLGNGGTVAAIGCEITVAGTTGTLIRLGLRANATGHVPGTVLGEATVAGDAIALVEATVSIVVPSDGLYWLTATAQNTGAQLPTIRSIGANLPPVWAGSLAGALGNTPLAGYSTTATVTGALSTYTVNNRTGAAPLIAIRI